MKSKLIDGRHWRLAAAAFVLMVPLAQAVPAPQDARAIPYLSGGIGEAEQRAIESAAQDYNLKLILSERSGAYAAAVSLTILDARGQQVFVLPDAGPIVLVDLPQGRYQIQARYDGRPIETKVAVLNARPKTVHLTW